MNLRTYSIISQQFEMDTKVLNNNKNTFLKVQTQNKYLCRPSQFNHLKSVIVCADGVRTYRVLLSAKEVLFVVCLLVCLLVAA